MGTTSNYSWPTPEATDLVKDGWEAIKDLGDAIDTTAAASFGGGLVHIETVSISSGVTGISLNNVFSATYKNYLVLASITTSTGNSNSMRLRVGGADNTSNVYIRQVFAGDSGSFATSSLTSTAFDGVWIGNSTVSNLEAILYNPFEAAPTMHLCRTMSGAGNSFKVSGGIHTASTSFDGFTLNAASGTLSSGTVRVYGYKD